MNFISIHKRYNQIADALARRGACYNLAHYKRGALGVKVKCRPSIHDVTNFW